MNILIVELIQFFLFVALISMFINSKSKEFDVPFFASISASLLILFEMIIIRNNIYGWILIALISAGLVVYLSIKSSLKVKITKEILTKFSFTRLFWCISLILTTFLIITSVLYHPSYDQAKRDGVSNTTILSSESLLGADFISHVNLMQAINETGETAYYQTFNNTNENVQDDLVSYPQATHVSMSIFATATTSTFELLGGSSDISLAVFMSTFLFFIAAFIAAICVLVLLLSQCIRKTTWLNAIIPSAVLTTLLLAFTNDAFLKHGFVSLASATLGLILIPILEIQLPRAGLNNHARLLLRSVLLIWIGHTWWVLLPFAVLWIIVMAVVEATKKPLVNKENFITLSIFAASCLLSIIPAILQIFVAENDPRDTINLSGGVTRLPVPLVLAVGCVVLLGLALFAWKTTNGSLKNYSFFTLLFFGFVVAIDIYQKITINEVSYYGQKMTWTLLWFIIATSAFFVILAGYWILDKAENKSRFVYRTAVALLILCSIVAGFGLLKHEKQDRSQSAMHGPNLRQLQDFLDAFDDAQRGKVSLLVASDCDPRLNFTYQRLSFSMDADFSRNAENYYARIGSDLSSAQIYSFLPEDTENYEMIDLTPLFDTNAPENRILKPFTIVRTKMIDRWETEGSYYCSHEALSRQ